MVLITSSNCMEYIHDFTNSLENITVSMCNDYLKQTEQLSPIMKPRTSSYEKAYDRSDSLNIKVWFFYNGIKNRPAHISLSLSLSLGFGMDFCNFLRQTTCHLHPLSAVIGQLCRGEEKRASIFILDTTISVRFHMNSWELQHHKCLPGEANSKCVPLSHI